MMIMFVESVLLALLGGFVGWLLGHLLIGLAGSQLTPLTWHHVQYVGLFDV